MAAVTESIGVCGYSAQDILCEVRNFLRGTIYEGKVNSENLAQSALYLLRTLPAARHAVLEHLCNVFDEAVSFHMLQLDLGSNRTTDDIRPVLQPVIQDASGVLLNFIKTNPESWASIISAWSLELLGQISTKYADRRGVPHSGSLNELLQLWMTCHPTKILMEVATECFAAMVGGTPDVCVDALLEASVKYSPHFDWVVAHIGSCFPTTIITRVLMCGLKDFCSHSGSSHTDMDMSSVENIPKMASVVGILGHLASKHGQDIRKALMNLFEENLQAGSSIMKMPTVPFLLQLASMSTMLLQVLTTDFIKTLTPEVLNKLHDQFSPWKLSNRQEFDSFLSLVVHLITKSDAGAYQVIRFLLDSANPQQRTHPDSMEIESYKPEVQKVCAYLLDQLCLELQKVVYNKHSDTTLEIPLLTALSSCQIDLARDFLKSNGCRAAWLLKLLSYVALFSSGKGAAQIFAVIVNEAGHPAQLTKFLQLQKEVELGITDIIPATILCLVDSLQPHGSSSCRLQLLRNILHLVRWEKGTKHSTTVFRSSLSSSLQQHFETLLIHLAHPDLTISMVMLKIIIAVGIPTNPSCSLLTKACCTIVLLFYRILHNTGGLKSLRLIQLCKSCLCNLCNHKCSQAMLLQFLLEGALSPENVSLFGSKLDPSLILRPDETKNVSLMEENQKLGVSLTMPRSHSSVFHAGIIGQGLNPKPFLPPISKEQISRNRQSLLDVLWICSQARGISPSLEGVNTKVCSQKRKISDQVSRQIGNILVSYMTLDVMYNGPAWPDEEFMRVTIERDLWVWKKFEDYPILWELLDNLAGSSTVLLYCSPLMRSLVATLMNHFESSRAKLARSSPKHLEAACKVIQCMRKSQLLPPPLGYIAEMFPYLKPFEVYLLLQTAWVFMKENPPLDGFEKRECDPVSTSVINSILHSNIAQMGPTYKRLFRDNAKKDDR